MKIYKLPFIKKLCISRYIFIIILLYLTFCIEFIIIKITIFF
nr:MAG TPA: hypothetical protein [Bacteriophage sp.]